MTAETTKLLRDLMATEYQIVQFDASEGRSEKSTNMEMAFTCGDRTAWFKTEYADEFLLAIPSNPSLCQFILKQPRETLSIVGVRAADAFPRGSSEASRDTSPVIGSNVSQVG